MAAYYNENDPRAAAWLRELIRNGHIAPGDVDERSIRDVSADDLRGFRQCHFFAGIGVWSYALRLAGWDDDRPVWTGSCPCQPFSSAGARKGVDDDRHLWPVWFRLIAERRPDVVFGEQVASKDGLGWLDSVYADLEAADYACGAVDLCAAGVGAPHIRQRLFFVADADGWNAGAQWELGSGEQRLVADDGRAGFVADADSNGRAEAWQRVAATGRDGSFGDGAAGGMADACADGPQGRIPGRADARRETVDGSARRDGADCDMADAQRPGPTNGVWRNADWLFCRDGKWRPVEAGTFPLFDGSPARVGRLRGYGNAIVPQVAAEVIGAYMDLARIPRA